MEDADLYYIPHWLSKEEQTRLYQLFQREIAWKQDEVYVFGRWHRIPRLQAWYGDESAEYEYSGKLLKPLPWLSELKDCRDQIERLGITLNSVLANWYRNGEDKMGWHSDNEAVLGFNPVIASLSLGTTRTFQLRHRFNHQRVDLELEGGSLLIMAGSMQHYWQHAVPVRKKVTAGRMNLTFRNILPSKTNY